MQSFRKSVASSFLCSKGAGYSSSLGTIGLMKAVDTFDSTRRARFSTYASRCIENAILSPAHFGMDLIFALTYMAFRKTRSRSSNVAFHAGCPENTVCST